MINIVISGGVNCENKEVAAVPDHGRHGAGGGKSFDRVFYTYIYKD